MSWTENFMSGHLTLGKISIFGDNAMHWSVNITTKKWGYLCFTLPTLSRILKRKKWYLYCSPNATPWASTFYIGSDKAESKKAKLRKKYFGHNFNSEKFSTELYNFNNGKNIRTTIFKYENNRELGS